MRWSAGLGAVVLLAVTTVPASGQVAWERDGDGRCEDQWRGRDRDRVCHVRTATIAAPDRLEIDGGGNGGVDVIGWSRPDVEIRARVWANARSLERAEELADEIRIEVANGRISADGPRRGRGESWSVSFEVSVPSSIDLDVRTSNGGVDIAGVSGRIELSASNGGIRLSDVGGDVRGQTSNGGVHVELTGAGWQGEGLELETSNGGVRIDVEEGFDAELETGTVNGSIDIDFPVMVRGRIGRRLRTTLGDGGARVRVFTTNGSVRVQRIPGA